jgi:hypothetical protein
MNIYLTISSSCQAKALPAWTFGSLRIVVYK